MATHVLADNNFLVPNATFIVEFVAFLIILGIIAKYILPYIQKPLAERQEIIRQQMEDAETTKAKLAEAEEAYKNALTEARLEAARIRELGSAERQRIVEEARHAAQEESERIIARGEELLVRQRTAIVQELRAEIGTMAVELSERIIDQRLTNDDQVRATIDAFIAGLEARDDAASGTSAGSKS